MDTNEDSGTGIHLIFDYYKEKRLNTENGV